MALHEDRSEPQGEHDNASAQWPPPGVPRYHRTDIRKHIRKLARVIAMSRGRSTTAGRYTVSWPSGDIWVSEYSAGPYAPEYVRLTMMAPSTLEITCIPSEVVTLAAFLVQLHTHRVGGGAPAQDPPAPMAIRWPSIAKDYGWTSRADGAYVAWLRAWRQTEDYRRRWPGRAT